MRGKVGFVLPKEAFGAPTGGGVAERGEDALRDAGVRFAFSEQPDEYRFSRMGGWPVPFRSSITRVRTAFLTQPLSASSLLVLSQTRFRTAATVAGGYF